MSKMYEFMIDIIIWSQLGYDKKIYLINMTEDALNSDSSDQSNEKGTI